MIVGKVFEFPSKPEQPGLSSSIRFVVMMEQIWYMQIWPIQLVSPHPCLPPVLLLLNGKENRCGDHFWGWGHKIWMYWNHIVKKIVFYYTSQSNEPLIYNGAFYLHRVVVELWWIFQKKLWRFKNFKNLNFCVFHLIWVKFVMVGNIGQKT